MPQIIFLMEFAVLDNLYRELSLMSFLLFLLSIIIVIEGERVIIREGLWNDFE